MKILLVGDMNSIHIYNFVNETLLKMNTEKIVIWGINSQAEKEIEESNYLFYKKNNISLIICESHNPDKFYDLMKGYEQIKAFGTFDVCHLHFLAYSIVTIGLLVKSICKKIISNYWGSDWFRSNDTLKQYQKYLLELSDYIVADSPQICEQVKEYYQENFEEKIKYIRFKTPVISQMQSGEINTNAKNAFMEKYGIPTDRILVTCGYCASQAHNHKGIIKAIESLTEEDRNKLFMIIPMTYGKQPEYMKDIKQRLKEAVSDGVIIENYMDFKEVALLRFVTDIFINIEPTDAYSSTMVEYAYCNKITIIGSWLDYSELEKKGAYFEKVDKAEELTTVLKKILDNFEDTQGMFLDNKVASEKFQEDQAGNKLWEKLYYEKPLKDRQMVFSEDIRNRVAQWILKNNNRNIGIYGMGILGGIVYKEIANVMGDEHIYTFDKNLKNISWYSGTVLKPEMMEEKEMSVVIITPGSCMDQIKASYIGKIEATVLTFVEWLEEL
ncbi:MAG: glycosyltransferase family 4 protein [Lachnospiraceae bacterium]|nr:glycosyltransferase family 4 protein [Lachnospiraceae bacterium]